MQKTNRDQQSPSTAHGSDESVSNPSVTQRELWERVGEEIHNGPLQLLSAQSMMLQLLAAGITEPSAQADLEEAIDAGRQAIHDINSIMGSAEDQSTSDLVARSSHEGGDLNFQSVFEQVPGSLLLLDPGLSILAASDAYLDATMTTREGIVGLHLFEAFPDNPDDASATGTQNLAASLDRVRRYQKPDTMAVQKYDVRRPEVDGADFETRYWSPVNTPVLSPSGGLLAIIHRVDDVTELTRQREVVAETSERTSELEEQTTTLEERLFLRGKELERANERLLELDRLKSNFLSRMSHELRTPLNAVIGFAQLLEMDDLSDSQTAAVHDIHRAGTHLLDLINEVLDVAQIESGRINLSVEPVPLRELVLSAIDLVRPLADRRSIMVNSVLPAEDVYVRADQQRSLQVLLNLLSNAVKYNRPAGSVLLKTAFEGANVRIFVTDHGLGISPENQHRLFAPFDRLGQEQTDIEGTGVGLMLARELALHMGGTLDLHTSDSEGSTFVFELPRSKRPAPRSRTSSRSRRPVSDAGSEAGPITILYIEDNLANLRLIEAVLAKLPAITLVTAMQGRLGFELATEHRPDLVLLDVHLPDINGDEVLTMLRAHPATEQTTVVYLSADATAEHVDHLTSLGADGYLTKPIDIAELVDTIDRSRRTI